MRKIPLLACLLVALLFPPPSNPETLRLPTDSVAAMILGGRPCCLVSEHSRFEWKHGELIPLGGLFSYYAANQLPIEARLAVPEQTARGEARSRGRRYILYLAEVEVRYKRFRSEEIAFNQSLSALMTTPDPRKVVEFHELREILASFHSRSLFHTETLSLPVEATRRTSQFADRRLYSFTDGGSSRSLHNGIDLAAPEGTPVFASGAGRVVLAKERIITGNSVVIEHLPGVFSLYYHLQDIEVQEGQRLFQGQRIGTVGMTGLATGPHLHWELRVSGVAVDPDFFVGRPMIDITVFSSNIMDQN